MAGEGTTRAAQIRAELEHPIVDADGHFVEVGPLLNDEIAADVEETGGAALRDRYLPGTATPTDTASNLDDDPIEKARDRWISAPSWWGWQAQCELLKASFAEPAARPRSSTTSPPRASKSRRISSTSSPRASTSAVILNAVRLHGGLHPRLRGEGGGGGPRGARSPSTTAIPTRGRLMWSTLRTLGPLA